MPFVQLWGTSDPYCVLSIGENEARTRHRDRTLHPTWHESLQLYVRHAPYLSKLPPTTYTIDSYVLSSVRLMLYYGLHDKLDVHPIPCTICAGIQRRTSYP